jgi:hypothetical protein
VDQWRGNARVIASQRVEVRALRPYAWETEQPVRSNVRALLLPFKKIYCIGATAIAVPDRAVRASAYSAQRYCRRHVADARRPHTGGQS